MSDHVRSQFIGVIWIMTPILALTIFFSASLYAFTPGICKKNLKELNRSGPAVLPEAPPVPKKAPVEPQPITPRPSEPKRREIPIPNEPAPKIPAKPLEDPKDIQPEDLYASDSRVAFFWREMPIGLRRLMIEEMKNEKEKLQTHMRARYGGAEARTLIRATLSLQSEIEAIEVHHKKEILNIIGEMMEKRYGPAIQSLSIRITNELPRPTESKADGRMIPELPKSLDEGMVYRTEMRNLWLQGEGWVGMKEFAYLYAPELNAIQPGLAEKYQELDRLYRIGQLAQIDLIPFAEALEHLPKEAISAGREIVSTDFEIVERDGASFGKVKNTRGIAVGRNGWAAAHEARKAASQMATSSEGVFRWMMPIERREKLNEATNSARAEIRQGVFGPAVVQSLKKRIDLVVGKSLEDERYYQIMDGYFSLPPSIFIQVNKLIFDSTFEVNGSLQGEVRKLLKANGVIE